MYSPHGWEATQRQHDLLARAREDRQAYRARALRRAERRADRAERQLGKALSDMVRLRGQMSGS